MFVYFKKLFDFDTWTMYGVIQKFFHCYIQQIPSLSGAPSYFFVRLVLIIRSGHVWPPHVPANRNTHTNISLSSTEDPLETWGCFDSLCCLNSHPYLLTWEFPDRRVRNVFCLIIVLSYNDNKEMWLASDWVILIPCFLVRGYLSTFGIFSTPCGSISDCN